MPGLGHDPFGTSIFRPGAGPGTSSRGERGVSSDVGSTGKAGEGQQGRSCIAASPNDPHTPSIDSICSTDLVFARVCSCLLLSSSFLISTNKEGTRPGQRAPALVTRARSRSKQMFFSSARAQNQVHLAVASKDLRAVSPMGAEGKEVGRDGPKRCVSIDLCTGECRRCLGQSIINLR